MRAARRGYSLYELLLVLLLVSILAGVAIPSFGQLLARARIGTEIDALFHAVHLARKESIMRRQVVSLCPSPDGRQCDAGRDWSAGWIMFNNRDGDDPPRVDPGEALLQRHLVRPEVRIRANRRGFTLRATFQRATNGTLVVCDAARRVPARALVVSYTGRPRVATADRSGRPYDCAD